MRGTICSMRATAGQISYLSPERIFALSNLISDNLERRLFCMQSVVSERIGLALDDWLSAFTCYPASPRTHVLGHSQSSPFDKLRAGSAGLIAVDNAIRRANVARCRTRSGTIPTLRRPKWDWAAFCLKNRSHRWPWATCHRPGDSTAMNKTPRSESSIVVLAAK
jgi:hypothetical protein